MRNRKYEKLESNLKAKNKNEYELVEDEREYYALVDDKGKRKYQAAKIKEKDEAMKELHSLLTSLDPELVQVPIDLFKGPSLSVLEFHNVKKTFADFLKEDSSYEDKMLKLYQALLTIDYIHSKRLIHHNIQPKTILIDDKKVKLSGFDYFSLVKCPSSKMDEKNRGRANLAPEYYCLSPGSYASDMWDFGFLMLHTFYPAIILEYSDLKARQSIFKGKLPFAHVLLDRQNPLHQGRPEIGFLLEKILSIEPSARPTASELLNDDLFAAAKAAFEAL